VPRFRRGTSDHEVPTRNPEILDQLEKNGYLCYTPSRYVNNKLIIPYDDRFILKAAVHYNAIIVSNDNYRDLWNENNEWKRHIETSLLQYSFIGDLFMVADDPLGRSGPNIDQFLSNKQ
jgi:ribonuclease ZC3H12